MRRINTITLILLFSFSIVSNAQSTKDIIIANSETENWKENLDCNTITFKLEPNFFPNNKLDYFVHKIGENYREKFSFSDLPIKPVSKLEADNHVRNLIDKKAKNNIDRNIRISLMNFNSYFRKVYIYNKEDETLYEVKWVYVIKD